MKVNVNTVPAIKANAARVSPCLVMILMRSNMVSPPSLLRLEGSMACQPEKELMCPNLMPVRIGSVARLSSCQGRGTTPANALAARLLIDLRPLDKSFCLLQWPR